MKLQVVCQHYYPESYPLASLCPALVKNGDTVRVLTGLPNYPEGTIYKGYGLFKNRRQQLDGVDVVRAALIPRGKSKAQLFLNYASFAFFGTMRAFFIKKDFDAILVIQTSPISMAVPGMLLKKLTKKPLYIYCFDLWPESLVSGGIKPNSWVYTILKRFSKWVYKSADKIFVSSNGFKPYFSSVHGIKNNVHYLAFYAEDLYASMPKKQAPAKQTHVVFAGNIGQLQSVQTIVKAAKHLSEHNVVFTIAGDGSAKAECEALTKQLNLSNIHFTGKLPFDKMPSLYANADAMLITLADNKLISYTLPNKLLGYLAAAKPIIASVSGEAARVVDEAKCGFTCKAQDDQALANCILQFINAKNKEQLGKNAREYYKKHFTTDIFIKTLKQLMD